MTIDQLAYRVARAWLSDSAPDSMRVAALMAHVKLALLEAVAAEREACAAICDEGIALERSPTGLAHSIRARVSR